MSAWNFVELAEVGDKKDVNAFNRIALQLPVLSEYVIERNGKPVTFPIYEDMVFEKPQKWRKYWWRSSYRFQTKVEAPLEMVRDVSQEFPRLCFRLDWDWEHEEFGTHFVRKGKVESHSFNAQSKREHLFKEMTGGAEGDYENIDVEIDEKITQECEERFDKLWQSRIYRVLYAQRQRRLR